MTVLNVMLFVTVKALLRLRVFYAYNFTRIPAMSRVPVKYLKRQRSIAWTEMRKRPM